MASTVRTKVQELYLHHDPAVKQAADAALQEFQKSDLAWGVSQELLEDADASVQFFAAQTLYAKVQQVANGYAQAEGSALCHLAARLQQYLSSASLSQQSKQRLVLALSALAVHLCSSSWRTAVTDLLALAESQPQYAWCVILAIPEQLSSVVHTYLKTDRRTDALLNSSAALLAAALRYGPTASEEAVTGTISDSPFSLAMQSMTQWSKVMGLPLVVHEGFADRVVELLQGPAGSSELVLELVMEILRSSPGAFAIYEGNQGPPPALGRILAAVTGAMQGILPVIQQMACRPAVSLEEADSSRLSRWGRVAGTLVEAYTQVLWVEKSAADILITFLGACFVVHPHIARSVFELWAILKDTNRDSKLPPGVLTGLLQHLALPCISSLTRFGRFDSPHAEDAAELTQLREAQQDIIVDMYCIAEGTPEARRILTLLQEHLQSSEASKDWHGVEVAWFAFSGIAEALAGESSIPEVYGEVLQSIFRAELSTEGQCETAAALLRACGPHFETGLQAQLVGAVQWLVGMVPRIPLPASETVQELCGYAGQHLVPHVLEFLKVVQATAPAAPPDVDASLHGALIGIARNLPDEQVVEAFAQILEGTSVLLKEGIDVTIDAGRQKLHRCTCRLLRCTLVMEQGGSSSDSAPASKPGQATLAARAAGTCLARFLSTQWSLLAPPCQRLLCAASVPRDAPKGEPIFDYSDAAVQVNSLALLRYGAKAANNSASGGPELSALIVELAIACCREGQLACLYAVSVLAANQHHAKCQVMPALDGVCQAALVHIQAGRSEVELVPFLELVSVLATGMGDDLFCSAQVPMLAQLCIMAVRSTDQEILKPTLQFLHELVMCRTLVSDSSPVMQAVLLHFHTWPRSVGGMIFKLFSAFLERHEAVFLHLACDPAVPSMAGLPPAERAVAQRAVSVLRGPRLRAFLADLGAVARSENTVDVLQAYTVADG